MVIETRRFGPITIHGDDQIAFPSGVLGFPDLKRFALIDPGDDTLILWLQSLDSPEVSFPVLEPRVYKPDYVARLSGVELRELKLDSVNQSAVFSILTIPEDVAAMTANLKAPLVVNLREQLGKQVVLQENDYAIRFPMFRELRAHLATIRAQRSLSDTGEGRTPEWKPVPLRAIPPSLTVKGFQSS